MINKKIDLLRQKGVNIPNPESVYISENVNLNRISGQGVSLYAGTKIIGERSLILANARIGYESPVTLENTLVGENTRLNGGFFQDAVFAGDNVFGSGGHVRKGTILEEEANAAHTVGLKQTILFPFVTLGSLINFCDCFMAGSTNLGENYIQEAVEKIDTLGRERACWHFIGHLQSNKAKFAVKYFDYIHTVDKVKLAWEIDKQAAKIKKVQKILLQINIAQEDTKSGAGAQEAISLAREFSRFENLSLEGLMCMPPYFSDPEEARIYFKKLVRIQKEIKGAGLDPAHLSMGMSNDFKVAIEEGSTMVRVGTAIFGSRD